MAIDYEPDPDLGTLLEHGLARLVLYSENQWMRYDEAGQNYCKEVWTKNAKAAGFQAVALKLIPDEVFPMFGHNTPYLEWQSRIEPDTPPKAECCPACGKPL